MKFKNTILASSAGIILGFSFPTFPLFVFAFVGFIILFFLFSDENLKGKYLYLYITFFIYHAMSNWWIGSWQPESDPYLTISAIALAIAHPFFFMVPFAFLFKIRQRFSYQHSLYFFPFIWVAFEWVHNLGEFSYPWLTVGNTQIYNFYWIQFIDITGVWGASFLIILVNVIIFDILNSIQNTRNFKSAIFQKKVLITFLVLIFIIPMAYGFFRLNDIDNRINEEKEKITVGIVQPAINPWKKWASSLDEIINVQFNISDSLVRSETKPDLVIWNETAIPKYINTVDKFTYEYLSNWVVNSQTSILTGFAELKLFNSQNKTATARFDSNSNNTYFESYNSLLLLNNSTPTNPIVYQKMRLTPFAERLPYSEALLFMRSWFEWGVGISAWGIGKSQHNMDLLLNDKSISIGPVICIESIYPEFVRNTAKNGADFLVIVTNDAWYDYTPGPEQHYLIACMRAIENRRYIVRVANTGVSGLISPKGNTVSRLEQYQQLGLNLTFPILKIDSIYVKFGDWFAIIASFISIITFIFSYFKKKQ